MEQKSWIIILILALLGIRNFREKFVNEVAKLILVYAAGQGDYDD